MPEISVEYTPSNLGLVRALPAVARKTGQASGSGIVWLIGIFFAAAAATFLQSRFFPQIPGYGAFAVWLLACYFWFVFAKPGAQRRMAKRFDELLPPIPTRIVLGEDAIMFSDANSEARYGWSDIRGLLEAADGIVILVGYGAMFVPNTAFATVEDQRAFVAFIGQKAVPK